MGSQQQDDLFDYCMSDLFISETRPRPYFTGFRSRRLPQRPSLAYINSLCDQDFTAYHRNGCRLPWEGLDVRAELEEVRAELRNLRTAFQALKQAGIRMAPNNSGMRGGIDVPPRA